MDEEEKELLEYQKYLDEEAIAKKLVEEYKSFLVLLQYPPLNLKKVSEKFDKDFFDAIRKAHREIPNNTTISAKIYKKWKSEIDEAKAAYNNGKTTTLEAAKKYMKSNKTISQSDFVNSDIFRQP